MDKLTQLVRSKYSNVADFAQKKMKMPYRTFRHKVQTQSFSFQEFGKLMKALPEIEFPDYPQFTKNNGALMCKDLPHFLKLSSQYANKENA